MANEFAEQAGCVGFVNPESVESALHWQPGPDLSQFRAQDVDELVSPDHDSCSTCAPISGAPTRMHRRIDPGKSGLRDNPSRRIRSGMQSPQVSRCRHSAEDRG